MCGVASSRRGAAATPGCCCPILPHPLRLEAWTEMLPRVGNSFCCASASTPQGWTFGDMLYATRRGLKEGLAQVSTGGRLCPLFGSFGVLKLCRCVQRYPAGWLSWVIACCPLAGSWGKLGAGREGSSPAQTVPATMVCRPGAAERARGGRQGAAAGAHRAADAAAGGDAGGAGGPSPVRLLLSGCLVAALGTPRRAGQKRGPWGGGGAGGRSRGGGRGASGS